jgi:hypothetical protein
VAVEVCFCHAAIMLYTVRSGIAAAWPEVPYEHYIETSQK